MELKEMKDYMYNCAQMSFNYGRHYWHLKLRKGKILWKVLNQKLILNK